MSMAAVRPEPAPRGVFVAVAGPSGAGKDAILNAARQRLAQDGDFVFARRVITRPAETSEDHEPLDERLFRRGIASGDFAMWWEAHDLLYGLPAELTSEVGAGRIVIANVSRGMIDQARRVFGTCHAVHITAHPDILAARLAGRAREAVPEQIRRLNRPKIRSQSGFDTEIDNGGSLIVAVDRFVDVLFAIKRGAQGHG